MISKFYHWLHGQWPAGTVEKLPEVGEDGLTNIPGIRIVGDLGGVPLLKFSSDTGAKAIQAILAESDFDAARQKKEKDTVDIAIIGGGVSGFSAAMEAKKAGLDYVLYESTRAFSTVENFPKGKPIFTYPTELKPAGGIHYEGEVGVKETLLQDMKNQVAEAGVESTEGMIDRVEKKGSGILLHHADGDRAPTRALRCIVAIGRSGNYRKMGIPGEDLDKVSNRLHDPAAFRDKDIMVVGGGDSAAEAAIALADAGARVTLSYRKSELNRPKPENIARVNELAGEDKINLRLETNPTTIDDHEVVLKHADGSEESLRNDAVLAALGREAPLDFFRRSGLKIANDKNTRWWVTLAIGLLVGLWIYHWKKNFIGGFNPQWVSSLIPEAGPGNILTSIKNAANDRSFYYSLAYCLLVLTFGIRRIKRRQTPYVMRQTIVLNLVQWIPLFILPYLLLPWMGVNGWFADGSPLSGFADLFFEKYDDTGHSRAYWRAFGFVLAWPLFVFNLFTEQPMVGWLVLSLIQTFIIIPLIVRRWGKGAYCGWICSCGALAETMGDAHRQKMPHGPFWTKLNMIGQVFLWFAFAILGFRIIGWILPGSFWEATYQYLVTGGPLSDQGLPFFNYSYFVDLLWAGVIGVSFYFHLSGRVWCRFACPLSALMQIYQRAFGKFRIFAEKDKCISCNVCTSVCHQGIDIMNFANKGKPMEDPECVRCSACVQQCPTGVLSFGRLSSGPEPYPIFDKLPASLVQLMEAQKEKRATEEK
ncbi:NAD(P)-binding domain-containing protein [Verrucomicrobiaceae bacterium 227]